MIKPGDRVRRWEVIESAHPRQGKPRWLCRCTSCRKRKVLQEHYLENRIHLACGCGREG